MWEYSLNEFCWISWNITKSQNGMATRNIVYLATGTFPVIVIESKFSLLYHWPRVGIFCHWPNWMYNYPGVASNSYFINTASSGNATIVRHMVFLVTMPLFDLVMIHWKSFRKNPNVSSRRKRYHLMINMSRNYTCSIIEDTSLEA